jgi:uroporphyrinogen-III synthase
VPAGTHLLRLAGAERIELVPPTGVTLIERTVYASEALPMPDDLAARLAQPCVVLLHSAEAARHFAMQCAARNVGREAIRLACIGPRVTAAAGDGWAAAVTASRPDETALLAKAAELCHT